MTPVTTFLPLDGGCLCGAVRYRIDARPLASSLCHCRSCTKAASAPSVAWVTFAREAFAFVAGTPVRHASSPGVARGFCGRCGSGLTYESDGEAGSIDVATVSLDRPELYPPTRVNWLEHRLAWACVDASMEPYPRGIDDDEGELPLGDPRARGGGHRPCQ